MKKALSVCSLVLRIVLCVLVGVLLVYNVYMLIAKLAFKQQMPTFFGFASAAVVSGSMEPTINTGDFIITLKRDDYEVGEVVMFLEGGVYTTHRIVEETEDGFRTMGDGNEGSVDPWTVREENIVGEVVLVLRGFGKAAAFFQTPAGMMCIVAAAALLWVLAELPSFIKKKKEKGNEAN